MGFSKINTVLISSVAMLSVLICSSLHYNANDYSLGRDFQVAVDTIRKIKVETIDDLRKINVKDNTIYEVSEAGKEGKWSVDKNDKSSMDNLGTVLVLQSGLRIKRIIGDTIQVNWFEKTNGASKNSRTISKKLKNSVDSGAVKSAINFIVQHGNKQKLQIDDSLNLNLSGTTPLKNGIVGKGLISYKGAIIYKEGYPSIGIPFNLDETLYNGKDLLKKADLISPPIAKAPASKGIDILAHFYNDMGLTSNALNTKSYHGWYDSRMFFTNSQQIDPKFEPYDPSRHPLLGWYQGDDVNVLDWQCYWLVKYGIKAVIPAGIINSKNYNGNKESSMFWVWNLMNKVKNFKQLDYILYLEMNSSISVTEANAQQDFIINEIIYKNKNNYCYVLNGKRYATFFVWDMELARGLYDKFNGSHKTVQRFKEITKKMQELGYDGICVLGRNFNINPKTYPQSTINDLKRIGCIVYNSAYYKIYGNEKYTTFQDYATLSKFPSDSNEVVNIITSGETRKPHPSNFSMKNSTPKAFSILVNRASNWIQNHNNPKMMTVYNVAEWAEGGPGLQPNQRDGFGYLEAIRNISPLKK